MPKKKRKPKQKKRSLPEFTWKMWGVIIVAFFITVTWLGATSPLKSGDVDLFDVGSLVTKTLTVTSPRSLDTDYSDKQVFYLSGKCILMKDETVISEDDRGDLTTDTLTCEFNQVVHEEGGYVYAAAIMGAESNYIGGVWQPYIFNNVVNATYPFIVEEFIPVPPRPIWETIWGDFVSGIQSLIDFLFGWL